MISVLSKGIKFQKGAGLSGYIAEMAGAFACASLGIVPTVRHADYIGSWLEVLREDNRAVVRAASAASKAADYLLAFLPQAIDTDAASNEEAA
jgi:antirestriction protein ArdC